MPKGIADLQRVEVAWVDSAFHRGWSSLDTKRKEMSVVTCRTLGYVIEDTATQLKLAQSITDDSASDAIAIPKACVVRMRKL